MTPRRKRDTDLMQVAAAVVGSAAAAQVVAPEMPLSVEQHLNTYADEREPGIYSDPEGTSAVGVNGRRIIVRDSAEGLYVGGVLLTDARSAHWLSDVIEQWAFKRQGRTG